MQRVLGYMRKAIQEFDLIQDGDRIAVGVSGGKDSVALLTGLSRLRRFIGIDYEVVGLTLDPQFHGVPGDYSAIGDLCRELEVPYILKRTQIGEIVFDARQESNPCSLCARMRRGALHDAAKEAGCRGGTIVRAREVATEEARKIFGLDGIFLMNLFNEGRVGCFAPKTYLSRKDLWMIRPLVFAPEKEIRRAVERTGLPVVKSKCPADGYTQRQATKEFLAQKERESSGFKYRIFGALRRSGVDGWGFPDKGADPIDQKEE